MKRRNTVDLRAGAVNDWDTLDAVHADVKQVDLFVEVEQQTDRTTSDTGLAVRDAVVVAMTTVTLHTAGASCHVTR